MTKPLNTDKELKRKIDDCCRKNTKKMVINNKPPDPGKVLEEKPTLYNRSLKR